MIGWRNDRPNYDNVPDGIVKRHGSGERTGQTSTGVNGPRDGRRGALGAGGAQRRPMIRLMFTGLTSDNSAIISG